MCHLGVTLVLNKEKGVQDTQEGKDLPGTPLPDPVLLNAGLNIAIERGEA